MSAEVPVAPGKIIAGKYRVERVLGQGGMGVVVSAVHEQLQQRVAIKFLLPEVASIPEAVERFTREARAAVRIQSEHVARVIDVGELETGGPYMVMEYLEGSDLAEVLARDGTLSVEQAAGFVLQAGEALSEAHLSGIVHRDLKPSNLFITRRADGSPCVKLLDFGISKSNAPGAQEAALTKTSGFLGSPLYVSPEQILSTRDADVRSDIWALGVILYEALSGGVPFPGDSVMEVVGRILQLPAKPLRELRPDLSPAVCDVVMKCLEKNRDLRFRNVGELAQALGPFAPGAGLSVDRISRIFSMGPSSAAMAAPAHASVPPPRPSIPSRAGGSTADGQATSAASSMQLPRKSPRIWLLGLGAALAAVAGLVFASTRATTPPSPVAAQPVAALPGALPTPSPSSSAATTPPVALANLASSEPAPAPVASAPSVGPTPARKPLAASKSVDAVVLAPGAPVAASPAVAASPVAATPMVATAAASASGAPTTPTEAAPVATHHNPLAVELK